VTTPRPIEAYPVAADLPAPPPADHGEAPEKATTAPARKIGEVAVLDFIGGDASVEIALAFPFRFDGREVRTVTVRRPSIMEIARVAPDFAMTDDFELYAVLAGLPAPVLRGMMREDREAVARAADDFLSREAGPDGSAPTLASGAASPSSPAAP
jgi:hypothetical protein